MLPRAGRERYHILQSNIDRREDTEGAGKNSGGANTGLPGRGFWSQPPPTVGRSDLRAPAAMQRIDTATLLDSNRLPRRG
jgi:hypothetical protein